MIQMKQRQSFTFDEETIKLLKEASDKTDIPQSRIAEKAIREACKELLNK